MLALLFSNCNINVSMSLTILIVLLTQRGNLASISKSIYALIYRYNIHSRCCILEKYCICRWQHQFKEYTLKLARFKYMMETDTETESHTSIAKSLSHNRMAISISSHENIYQLQSINKFDITI